MRLFSGFRQRKARNHRGVSRIYPIFFFNWVENKGIVSVDYFTHLCCRWSEFRTFQNRFQHQDFGSRWARNLAGFSSQNVCYSRVQGIVDISGIDRVWFQNGGLKLPISIDGDFYIPSTQFWCVRLGGIVFGYCWQKYWSIGNLNHWYRFFPTIFRFFRLPWSLSRWKSDNWVKFSRIRTFVAVRTNFA